MKFKNIVLCADTLGIIIIAISMLVFTANVTHALVLGESNFPFLFEYPEHTCTKPFAPMYGSEMSRRSYILDLEAYRDCVQTYIDNAKDDIERIKERVKDAVIEFNNNY